MILNKNLRKKIVEKSCELGLKHYGSALSCIDFLNHLYKNVLKEEDIFIMSKGHGATALYVVLEESGKSPEWSMHPEINEKEGIYATTGSLGHGLPIAVGRAFAKKIKNNNGKVHVLLGDCEISEGSNWEAMFIAEKLKINLNLFIDWNKYTAVDSLCDVFDLDVNKLTRRLESFGFKTIVIDGHDETELKKINYLGNGLNAVILDTIKGKGVEILEKTHFHTFYFCENDEEYKKTIKDLT